MLTTPRETLVSHQKSVSTLPKMPKNGHDAAEKRDNAVSTARPVECGAMELVRRPEHNNPSDGARGEVHGLALKAAAP
jgi:hypothetical protein